MVIRQVKKKRKIRAKVKGTKARPRLSVFRSNKAIYAQVIDDMAGKTLVAASEKDLAKKLKRQKAEKPKTERAELVGRLLAKKALGKGIKTVVFDRRGYKYHGRVKALANRARKGGLVF